MSDETASFSEVKTRLDEIVEEVAREDISLDEALSLYEEAVKLGLGACNLSESDIFPEEIAEMEAAEKATDDTVTGAVTDATSDTVTDEGDAATSNESNDVLNENM